MTLHARHPVVHFSMSTKHGSEGPSYDPYGYEEVFIDYHYEYQGGFRGGELTLHSGLGDWVKVEVESRNREGMFFHDETLCEKRPLEQDSFDELVEFHTGYTLTQMRRIYRKLEQSRLREHRGHGQPEWKKGFPGESFLMCPCGHSLNYNFNESAII